ncbi:MAG: hypothetical protein ACTHNY_11980 [Solirubrobacterales bacterium]
MSFVGIRIQISFAALAAAAVLLLAAASAPAATVVNGDFESGTLNGWQVVADPSPESGNWYAYSGTDNPFGEFGPGSVPPPPAGNYAAITSQGGPGTRILYQDVGLEAGWTHRLSLIVYYRSEAPLVNPSPDSLEAEGELAKNPNQQYRVDIIKPSAPIDSISSSDILATLFATKAGDPQELGPTNLSADLSAFAGQTIRLRLAEVDNQAPFFAGVDSVSISSVAPPPPPPPSNVFSFGKPTFNKKKGTAKLPVTVPGAGTVQLVDVKKTKKRVKGKTLQAAAAGTLQLPVKPTKSGRQTLLAKGKLPVKVAVTFTPTGGTAATQTRKLTLKLAPPQP